MKCTRKILTNNIKTGMILSEDLYINGLKLLSKDTKITEHILEKITRLYPDNHISVYVDQSDDFVQYKESIFNSLESKLTDMSKTIEKLFTSFKGNSSLELSTLRSLGTDIVNMAIENPSDTIKLINRPIQMEHYIYSHSLNTAILSVLIGIWLNQPQKNLINIAYGGLLHDIGKLYIPKDILYKSSSLSQAEFNLCKSHTVKAYDKLKNCTFLSKSVLQSLLFHHEKIDGSGYPMHLKGDKIPLLARIIAVADTFDAITSNHPYKTKKNPLFALQTIYEDSFSKFDAKIATTFIHNMSKYYEGTMIMLNDSEKAYIVKLNQNDFLKPIICIDNNVIDLSKQNKLQIVDFI